MALNDIIMLDTSAYSAFKRGQVRAIELVQSAKRVILPVVVLAELLAGFEIGSRREQNRAELDAFCRGSRVQITPHTKHTAERYAAIYAYLRAAGRPVPTNDLWVAASAMEHAAVLVTADAHFLTMPQLLTIHLGS
jgi:tRNA(fMet)-specific endonuclease VapC